MNYRPEIDGLRAVAVLPVIAFHGQVPGFANGYLGVDIFFVISGYLITTLIWTERAAGQFSLLTFFERRIRRLLPALLFVIGVCLPFAWLWMLPFDADFFGRSAVFSLAGLANFFFWQEAGYFSPIAERSPLLHIWSLAVEEQFYLILPLVLIVLGWAGLGRRFAMGLLAAVALASLLRAHHLAGADFGRGFYMLEARAWELLAGVLLALWRVQHPPGPVIRPGIRAQAGAVLGAVLIALGLIAISPFQWVLGTASLAHQAGVVVGTALILACATPATWVGRALIWRPFVGIGLISYSAYLWHQPLFAFARLRLLDVPPLWLMLALAGLSLLLAWGTWAFVEQPFRRRARGGVWPAGRGARFWAIFPVWAAVAALSYGLAVGQGWPQRFDPAVIQFLQAEQNLNIEGSACRGHPRGQSPVRCIAHDDQPRVAALWGDSHAMALAPSLSARLAEQGWATQMLLKSACGAIPTYPVDAIRTCRAHYQAARDHLLNHPEIELVILVSRFAIVLEGQRFDNLEGGVEPGHRPNAAQGSAARRAIWQARMTGEMQQMVQDLAAAGKTVVLVENIPEVGWVVPMRMVKSILYDRPEVRPVSTSYAVYQARNGSTAAMFAPLENLPGVLRLSPAAAFCNGAALGPQTQAPEGRCLAEAGGLPLYFDDDHLNARGAARVADLILAALSEHWAAAE